MHKNMQNLIFLISQFYKKYAIKYTKLLLYTVPSYQNISSYSTPLPQIYNTGSNLISQIFYMSLTICFDVNKRN